MFDQDRGKKTQDNTRETAFKSKAPSFDFLAFSVWGLFTLGVFSGVFLAVHYVPTFSQAFSSVERLNEEVPFGWMVRRLHAVGGNLLLFLFLIHLWREFYAGRYKVQPRIAWVLEVLLLFFTVRVNFTGSFLPLSHSAFWTTATVLSHVSSLPWIGGFVVEFVRGGKELGNAALGRFYSMHIGFSVLIGFLLFLHHRMGRTGKGSGQKDSPDQNLVTAAVAAVLLLGVATFAPDWFVDSLKEAAQPALNPERVSFPWYLLFLNETLPLFSAAYPLCSLLFLVLVLFLILFLPYIDQNPDQGLLLRPFAMALCVAFLVAGIYFSLVGSANARYGERVVVPDRALSAVEIAGAKIFTEKNCAYCHQVAGKGGRRQGPDMTGITRRGRSRDRLQRFISNARLYQPGTAMPCYEIPLEDLEALSAYLLTLDSRKEIFKTIDRTRFMEMSLGVQFQGEKR
jgi:quinol-cytochrome oxidoreductase complex cytochrome b subunit